MQSTSTQKVSSGETEMVILPSEDRIRMTRLYEEVFTRLEEMAMITSRSLRLDMTAGSTVRFNPVAADDCSSAFTRVEIVCTPHAWGCYDYREGACFGMLISTPDL